jgi:HK97 gp10 family phage protein
MADIQWNHAAIERLLQDAREDALIRAAARVAVIAQSLAPVGLTGHLRRSIERGDVEGGARWIWVVATAAYSIFVERGTGRYAVGGRGRQTPWVYYNRATGRYVWTDGTPPQPFMGPAVNRAAGEGGF